MVVQANAEIEATPVPLQVSSSSKDEGLERNSTMEADVEAFGGKREFKFVEFFAGMGGFSRAVGEVEGVKVLAVLDGYAGEWDVLEDQHFQRGVELCNEADHAHFAPMCRTFTMARRDDEFGSVRQLRSMKLPEGWVIQSPRCTTRWWFVQLHFVSSWKTGKEHGQLKILGKATFGSYGAFRS